jgi:hypothetical protein
MKVRLSWPKSNFLLFLCPNMFFADGAFALNIFLHKILKHFNLSELHIEFQFLIDNFICFNIFVVPVVPVNADFLYTKKVNDRYHSFRHSNL